MYESGVLSEEQELIRRTVSEIAGRFGRKYWLRCMRERRPPDELWREMVKAGLTGVGVPEECGGAGYGLVEAVLIQEGLAQHGIPLLQFLTTHLSRVPIVKYGDKRQIERFVTPTCREGKKISLCVTEAEAGSNTWRIKTFATRHGDKFNLTGQKVFITGAAESDFMFVVARTRRYEDVSDKRLGISLFVVDSKTTGIRFEKLDIDMRGPEWQYIVYFDDAAVEADSLIGEEGLGHKILFEGLTIERSLIAACSVGLGDYVISKAVEYAKQREVFGRLIGSNQGLQFPLARAKMRLEAARLMTYHSARRFDEGLSAGMEANMAKFLAAEAALEALDISMQVFGGNAFSEETDMVSFYPIIRLFKTAPITNELILSYVATHLLGLPKSY